jgi:hypothetical protein
MKKICCTRCRIGPFQGEGDGLEEHAENGGGVMARRGGEPSW